MYELALRVRVHAQRAFISSAAYAAREFIPGEPGRICARGCSGRERLSLALRRMEEGLL